ncbi:MAG TPA: hypothetical protein VK772_12585 [Puia sp.]|jgi:hypothetical protein|nr:hypothetical protein [Puia sp.]
MSQPSAKKKAKRKARTYVYGKFETALSEFKGDIKPKKLKTKLKKASKLFAGDIAKATAKKDASIRKKKKKITKLKPGASSAESKKEILP